MILGGDLKAQGAQPTTEESVARGRNSQGSRRGMAGPLRPFTSGSRRSPCTRPPPTAAAPDSHGPREKEREPLSLAERRRALRESDAVVVGECVHGRAQSVHRLRMTREKLTRGRPWAGGSGMSSFSLGVQRARHRPARARLRLDRRRGAAKVARLFGLRRVPVALAPLPKGELA